MSQQQKYSRWTEKSGIKSIILEFISWVSEKNISAVNYAFLLFGHVLTEFEHGSSKSVCDIPSLFDIPLSALSDIIAKWQHLGTTTSQPQSGRPRKGTNALYTQ